MCLVCCIVVGLFWVCVGVGRCACYSGIVLLFSVRFVGMLCIDCVRCVGVLLCVFMGLGGIFRLYYVFLAF